MAGGAPKKKQRVGSNSRYPSTIAVIDDESVSELSRKPSGLRRSTSQSLLTATSASSAPAPAPALAPAVAGIGGFNDSSSADVTLRLYMEKSPPVVVGDDAISFFDYQTHRQIYLHSSVLRRSKYFSALLSDRWQKGSNSDGVSVSPKMYHLSFCVLPIHESIDTHFKVLQLLYSNDFVAAIDTASTALSILPVALELLFEDCVRACIRFLEAVPWTEEEEKKVISLVPLLSSEESEELMGRLLPTKDDSSEEMLHELILSAIHTHRSMPNVKSFVAKLLREFSPEGAARRVLDRAFDTSLKTVKESLEEYSSPDVRGDHNETEAIQRMNLHTAMTNGRHLLWLIERMIELKVADNAVKEWSDQASFTADLLRAFRDDAWRNIVPALPSIILRCTSKLANAVASGNFLASRQVRMQLVKHWLPVLVQCKDNVSGMLSSQKALCLELEETFLKIISTLPMSHAQELLQQCLSFSARNAEDNPLLLTAFTTWFRRANRSSQAVDYNQ